VHLDTIASSIYPTDAQLDCSKNVKIYMRGAATCFGFSQPSSGSYYTCFAKAKNVKLYIKIYMRGAATCFGFSQPSSGSYSMCFAKAKHIE